MLMARLRPELRAKNEPAIWIIITEFLMFPVFVEGTFLFLKFLDGELFSLIQV